MVPGGRDALQAAFFRELLVADVAVGLAVVPTKEAAAYLGRFSDSDGASVLDAIAVTAEDRTRVLAEVERLIAEAGGDVRAAVQKRGIARELPSQLKAETAHALSESGARMRAPLRPLDRDRYMGFLPLGEGGMGVVYLALDTELNRRVAFKMIRAGTSDPLALKSGPVSDDAAARFVQEAVVTGGLEHPGIVPVYEMGSTPAGVPYYTMRVVRGERTLDDAIGEATTLEDRLHLLESLLKVCDTVGYAHSRGVIHRDLKPANIALGPYGEVVVLDWGLAKMTSRPDDIGTRWQSRLHTLRSETSIKTLTSALGTPGYMSPEAALGKVTLVDERSDVYSLGSILFRILTGQFPFPFATYGEYLLGVRKGISEVPGVPQGLGAICLTALATKREDRYPSVSALASALRAWLTESSIEREVDALLKEAERALDAAKGLEGDALLTQLDRAMALGTQVVNLRPGNARAEALRDDARALRDGAIAQRERTTRVRLLKRVAVAGLVFATAATIVVALLLDGKRREAEDARAREATERARAEEMAQFMLTDLRAGLQPIGRLDLLGTVAKKSLAYYEDAQGETATTSARRSRALALGQISEVLQDSGDMAGGLDAARQCQRVLEDLLALDPTSVQLQEDLALALNLVGDAQQEGGDLDEALASYLRSVALRRKLAEKDLARSLDRVAAVLLRRGDRPGAETNYEQSLQIRRRLLAQDPKSYELRGALATSLVHVGDLAVRNEGLAAALIRYREAVALRRALLSEQPNDADMRSDLAGIVFRVAYCMKEKGDAAGARTHYEESRALYKQQSELNPADAWTARDLALTLEALGNLAHDDGRTERALIHFQDALAIKQGIASRNRSNRRAQHDVGSAHVHVGDAQKAAGEIARALASYEVALAIARELATEEPGNTEWQDDLADAYFRYGQVCQLQEMFPEARAAFEQALSTFEQLVATDPKNTEWQRETGLTLGRLGDVATALDQPDIARTRHRRAVEVTRQLTKHDPSNLRFQSDFIFQIGRLTAIEKTAGNEAAALALYEEALPSHRRIVKAQPTPSRRRELSFTLYSIGVLRESAGHTADALPLLREAEAIHRGVPERADEHGSWTAALGRVALAVGPEMPRDYLEAAYLLYAQKDFTRSADYYVEALTDETIATDLARGNRYNAACAAALAGQAQRALAWLAQDLAQRRAEHTLDQRNAHFAHARVKDPDLKSLRDIPEFDELFR